MSNDEMQTEPAMIQQFSAVWGASYHTGDEMDQGQPRPAFMEEQLLGKVAVTRIASIFPQYGAFVLLSERQSWMPR